MRTRTVAAAMLAIVLLANSSLAADRIVLVELFTNTGCPYCPEEEDAVHALQMAHPDVAVVEYHAWWPSGADPFYLHNTADNSGRINYYNVTGTPTIKVDGRYPGTLNTLETLYANRKNAPCILDLQLSGSYDPGTRSGTVVVRATPEQDMPADDWVIRLALTESEIYFNTPFNDMHYNVMHDMSPSHQGTPVAFSGLDPVELSFDFTLPAGPPPNAYLEENCRFVAFVQPALRGVPLLAEVYQAAFIGILELDATGAPVAPSPLALEANYPNPFNPKTTLPVTLRESAPARVEILAADGRRVRLLHDGPLGAGRHELEWDGSDDAGRAMASGIYLARLSSASEVVSRRLVLIK